MVPNYTGAAHAGPVILVRRMHSVELTPVADTDQTQRPFDLFLIFAGANIVATTLQIGASLNPSG